MQVLVLLAGEIALSSLRWRRGKNIVSLWVASTHHVIGLPLAVVLVKDPRRMPSPRPSTHQACHTALRFLSSRSLLFLLLLGLEIHKLMICFVHCIYVAVWVVVVHVLEVPDESLLLGELVRLLVLKLRTRGLSSVLQMVISLLLFDSLESVEVVDFLLELASSHLFDLLQGVIFRNDAAIWGSRRGLAALTSDRAVAHDVLQGVEVELSLEVVWLVEEAADNADDVDNLEDQHDQSDGLDRTPFLASPRLACSRLASKRPDVPEVVSLEEDKDAQRNGPTEAHQDEEAGRPAVTCVDVLYVVLASLPAPEENVEYGGQDLQSSGDGEERDLEVLVRLLHCVVVACGVGGHDVQAYE